MQRPAAQTLSAQVSCSRPTKPGQWPAGGTFSFSGAATGAFTLTKTGAGILEMVGTKSYTGATTISEGILSANTLAAGGSASSIGSSSNVAANLVLNGGTLRYTGGTATTDRLFTLNTTGGTIEANGTGAVTFSNTGAIGFGGSGPRQLTLSGTSTANNTFASVVGDGSGGATSLVKSGSGTWILSGSSSFTGGTTVDAGTLQLNADNRLSTTGAITVNGGTLNFGGFSQSTSGAVTFAGGTVTNGTLSKTGGSYALQSGTINAVLAGSAGLEKTTASTMTLTGTHSYTGATKVSSGTLLVNGSIASSSGVEVASGATLGGSGTVSNIFGAGTVGPGNSPGILTSTSVDGALGTDFTFEFTQAVVSGTSTPIFSNAAASGNDVLRLTGVTPFTTALDADNVITVDFTALTLNLGDVYQGGFYSDSGDFFNSINLGQFNYLGVGEEFTIQVSTVEIAADFGSGIIDGGYITQFTVIPEPTTMALFGFSLGGLIAARRKKKDKLAA